MLSYNCENTDDSVQSYFYTLNTSCKEGGPKTNHEYIKAKKIYPVDLLLTLSNNALLPELSNIYETITV